MSKKDKDPTNEDFEKLENKIIIEKVDEIFRNHPKDYISKLEELGFVYYEDDDNEAAEEENARPENQNQRELVAYFENRRELSEKIFEMFSTEKAAENPNYPLFRRYFKEK